jgi:hypothetical protein
VPDVLISVYNSALSERNYHGDYGCPCRPDDFQLKALLWLADDVHDWSECEICKEGIDGGGNTERYQSALKDADSWDDFSLDGGGESA